MNSYHPIPIPTLMLYTYCMRHEPFFAIAEKHSLCYLGWMWGKYHAPLKQSQGAP